MWDVTWFDDDTGVAYRVAVRRMSIADSIAAESLQDEIARRDVRGRLLLRLLDYALLRHATARAERAVLSEPPCLDEDGTPSVPDDADWQPLALDDESVFLELPDWLFWLWMTAFIRKNPQYDRSYEALKKNALKAKPTSESESSSSENASAANLSEKA